MWNIHTNTIAIARRYLSVFLMLGLLTISLPLPHAQAQTLPDETIVEEQSPEAVIETGTGDAVSETYNFANTNEVNTTAPEDQPILSEPTDTPPTGLEATTGDASETETTPITADQTILEIENQATSTTAANTTAATGDNTASTSSGGTAIVATGDAYAYTNVVNLTNTNIINSEGFIIFLNQLFGRTAIDFRDMFDVFSDTELPSSGCTTPDCEASGLESYISNQTTINNDITVTASTGNNAASGGTAGVFTGDAYAAANVTNIANTNIIDSNYLVMTFSNFGDLLGDIILPGKNLLQALFQTSPSVQTDATIAIDNEATITNQVSINADTGGNTSTGSSSAIQTGSATSYSNVYNQVNTNAVNSDSFTILFRVHGDWAGNIFGLPEGLSYEHTAAGISISNTTSQSTPTTHNITATITNDAYITNNISVAATTGNNSAFGDELGYVATGDAYAAANVTNVANTNILGRNWSLLIFDIFGDWQGDLSFGQPDIWIGATANAINGTTAAGAEILYTITVSNLGDAKASNVILQGSLNSDLITLDQPMTDIVIGSVDPGETITKTFTAQVANPLPSGSFPIDLTAELTSNEPDADMTNNREVVTVIAENNTRRGGGGGPAQRSVRTEASDIAIAKSANRANIEPGDTVTYEVTVTNEGGSLYDAVLYDTLYNQAGDVILEQNWPLYTITTDETITINYEIAYATSSPPGTYFNRAQVLGYHKNTNPKYMQYYDSAVATVPLSVGGPTPLVLGVSTTTLECAPYLLSFSKFGQANNPQDVARLQTFLYEHELYTGPSNGYFDRGTEAAVKAFQLQQQADVLAPWGLVTPTGYVYFTTQKVINEIYCENTKTFPLTVGQTAEIQRYKRVGATTRSSQPNTPNNLDLAVIPTALPKKIVATTDPITPDIPLDTSTKVHMVGPTPVDEKQRTPSVLNQVADWIQNSVRTFGRLKFW